MKFNELGNTRYFVNDGTYETTGAMSYKVNPDLSYIVEMGGVEVGAISHPKGGSHITIWRTSASPVDLPLDSEFTLDVTEIRHVTRL